MTRINPSSHSWYPMRKVNTKLHTTNDITSGSHYEQPFFIQVVTRVALTSHTLISVFHCFSFVIINRQTSYESSTLRQDWGILRDFIGHHQSANQFSYDLTFVKSRKQNPQKLTQLSSRSHPRHLVGKKTSQKDTIIDITSDSQVNSNFPYRWSSASLTFNNYFYLFLHLYIT